MTDEEVVPYVCERMPGFVPAGEPVRLPEGNLNVVWRVVGEETSVIVKYAPPYIAANPEMALDPVRLEVEARCLDVLGAEGALASVSCSEVRPPHLIDMNAEDHILLMEDLGEVPTLGRWLREDSAADVTAAAPTVGGRLGRFIGQLHATTYNDPTYAEAFDNRPMQETRHAVQYQGVTEMLERGSVSDAERLGERAEDVGEGLLKRGRCLTMGDLWPPSVLVKGETLRIIDWELAHYGRPLQDVAHWCAHLWMQKHCAPSPEVATTVEALRDAFLAAYREALGDAGTALWTGQEKRDAAVHLGAEILVRAVGPFQDGYVYAGLAPEHPVVQEAVRKGAALLRGSESLDLLEGD